VLDAWLRNLVKMLLWLRYRVRLCGLGAVIRRGRSGILFLPNHPALIDPIILVTYLHQHFRARVLADQDQIDRFLVRWLARRAGVIPIPDLRRYGPPAAAQISMALDECAECLRRGQNVILYPAGHLYRSRYENLRGNSAVEYVLRKAPQARVVLVRTRGLWGSAFSLASGSIPDVGGVLRRGALRLLANLIFFSPRRKVTIELLEPVDFPRQAERTALNAYLERYYNADAPPNTYIGYGWWEAGGPRVLPEPDLERTAHAMAAVPEATRSLVTAYLRERSGKPALSDTDRLAEDLGLDSLAKAELMLWLAREFGLAGSDVDALRTVGDVLLATGGQAVVTRPVELRPVPAGWFRGRSRRRAAVPEGHTIGQVFLRQAASGPDRAIVADQISGLRTYRDLIAGVLILKPLIEKLPGERIGIMLPASVAAVTTFLSTLLAGKVPLMVNWTSGTRSINHVLKLANVERVLTARMLLRRLKSHGQELAGLDRPLVFLDEVGGQVSRLAKLRVWARSRGSWSELFDAREAETAVILVTSGSETEPKAVPLTHGNLLANIRDLMSVFTVRDDDVLIGFLPPFHSFGLTVTLLLPLLAGVRAVYHPNPGEGWVLARLIADYRVTLLCGTPTFLNGIARAASGQQLATLRLAVTGADRCPVQTYQTLARLCPQAVILEGYGLTECSPVVSVNRESGPRPGTIGKVLPSLEYAVIDPDRMRRLGKGAIGELLVRGPSVFSGYLADQAGRPFVELDGKEWYRTGDLVSEDQDGVLTFHGRLKRFVKVGGEMISLPAIEAALEPYYPAQPEEGPVIAVEATADETRPELILFTTRQVNRQTVNRQLREAGLSALHNISRVVQLEQIPVLGTGKTDYRALRRILAAQAEG